MDKAFTELWVVFQHGDDFGHIGFSIKQANHIGIAPQTRFTRQWLKDGVIVSILKRDRHCATFNQRIAEGFGLITAGV
ncbi:Uncharacterised protein [Yersinia enterocolitica]|nr:Uncharacterised protein [Yersinia enterocolitica]